MTPGTAAARPAKFTCQDCGKHVISYTDAGTGPRCQVCTYIVQSFPPHHQTAIRERLGVPLKVGP